MKFYSDKLNKIFDTAEACEKAEFEAKEKENREKILAERKAAELKAKKEQEAVERKIAAEKVEAAYKKLMEARTAYRKELEAFCEKYGSYHTTIDSKGIPSLFNDLTNIFNPFIFG